MSKPGKTRRPKPRLLAVAATALAVGTISMQAAAAPPAGVYGCYEPRLADPSRIGSMTFTPAPVVMFGLIDGSTYSDYDGHQGHYRYDERSGMLTMTDGSRQGWRYKKVGDWSFQMLDPQGKETSYTCPLEPQKDPLKRPW